MASIHLETQISADTLLNSIEQMSPRDLERLRKRVLSLRAKQPATALSRNESRLLRKINKPFVNQKRYGELIALRSAEALSPHEHAELLVLTQQNEVFLADRVNSLMQLAELRQTTLPEVMRQLGID